MFKLLLVLQAASLLATLPVAAAADTPSFSYAKCGTSSVTYDRAASPAKGVRTIALQLRSPGGTVEPGEMVEPSSAGKHPAILFVHWLGDPKTTNHTEFHNEAVALAAKGVASLSVDTMWAQPRWFHQMGADPTGDYGKSVAQVTALLCALDVLSVRSTVDPSRIAFVGHDFGAMFGALLAGVDPRPKWYVFMAGNDSMTAWYLLGKTIADRAAYEQAMAPLDILASLKQSNARDYLFQFAEHDQYIPAQDAWKFAMASPDSKPRAVLFYNAPHSLANSTATRDRDAWLLSRL